MQQDVAVSAELPALGAEAVVRVVAVPGAKDCGIVLQLFAAHQIAQGVVLIEVDGAVSAPGFRDAVELTVTGVGMGQHPAVRISGGLGAAKIVIGEGNAVAVAVGLFAQQTVSDQLFAGCQSPAAHGDGHGLAEVIIAQGIGLALAAGGTLDVRDVYYCTYLIFHNARFLRKFFHAYEKWTPNL